MKTTKTITTSRITLLTNKNATDTVFVRCCGPTPYPILQPNDLPCFSINVQAGYGTQWIKDMFGCEPDEVINT